MPRVGRHDLFEQSYRAKLKALLTPHGLPIAYEEDRATLDLGLHLYKHRKPGEDAEVGPVRVWFQCKGLRATTLAADEISDSTDIPVTGLPLDAVCFWYAAAEPVYLSVYLEAADTFLAEDVRDIVDRDGGLHALTEKVKAGQQTVTLRIQSDATLQRALERMPRHQSLRIDGPHFRGRPLGHRYDPLRSELAELEPESFRSLVNRLLEVHEFRPGQDVALAETFAGAVGELEAMVGTLHLTYEWMSPLFTEFGFDPGSGFRIEAPPEHAQGRCLVVIHAQVEGVPDPTMATEELLTGLHDEGIAGALVFINAPDLNAKVFGSWRQAIRPFETIPQGLGSLAFNVLTSTVVYLEFQDQLRWSYVNYL